MKKEDFKEVSIEELISYSKQKEVPAVSIIDSITNEDFEYIDKIVNRLKVRIVIVKNSNMIAVIGNQEIAKKLAIELKRKVQIMYVDFFKRPSGSITIYALTGHTKNWTILRDNGYIIQAYNENGEQIESWVDTNIKPIEPTYLNSLNLSIYKFCVYLRGKGESGNITILKHSRQNYINDGIYNEKRNCYYPQNTTNHKDIAEYNKLEKLFKKWGFKSL